MSFEPKDYYNLALSLVTDDAEESYLRTAISRTYYACHLLAREKLLLNGWEPSRIEHSAVIRELRKGKTRDRGDELNLLREYREHADYHLKASPSLSNPDCSFCEEIHKSLKGPVSIVNQEHWKEVQETSKKLFPLLEKL
jgi:uncharacterized protein (UPF0332 family)